MKANPDGLQTLQHAKQVSFCMSCRPFRFMPFLAGKALAGSSRIFQGCSHLFPAPFFRPFFIAFICLLTLSACLLPRLYESPPGGMDRALIKLRFSPVQIIPGAEMYRQVWITTEPSRPALALDAYQSRLAHPDGPLEIEAVFVPAGRSITLRMDLVYKWEIKMVDHDPIYRYGPRQTRPHWVSRERRRGCRAEIAFAPAKDASYLLDFTSIATETCQIKAYEMLLEEGKEEGKEAEKAEGQKEGSFRLEEVGEARGREILDDSPLDWGSFEFDSGF